MERSWIELLPCDKPSAEAGGIEGAIFSQVFGRPQKNSLDGVDVSPGA